MNTLLPPLPSKQQEEEESTSTPTTTTTTATATTIITHDDSGHESGENSSSPEVPSTPQEERSITPGGGAVGNKSITTVVAMTSGTTTKDATDEDGDADGQLAVYRIRIQVPNGEPIEVQIGENDMVQELYHLLLERDPTCHRTCFKLYYESNALDHFTEIRNIPNIKSRSTFKVVEELYKVREARIHVRHLRELLRSLDRSDAANGLDFASFSCLTAVTHHQSSSSADSSSHNEPTKRSSRATASTAASSTSTSTSTDPSDCMPPDYLMPNSKDELPLTNLLPQLPESKLNALKAISISAFNPPPGNRKLKGDVIYLVADTVEGLRFHITCCTRGFYVNGSSDDHFNPDPPPPPTISISNRHHSNLHHSLFDLLSEVSVAFRKCFPQILKARGDKHVHERMPTPYQCHSWMVPPPSAINNHYGQDQMRADDLTQPHRLGLEDHVPGQVRDWNEELQTTCDMPRTTFTERMCRDRARFKVHADFVAASVRGATSVIEGSILTINPMDEPRAHMFIWNSIFFSLGFDVKDHYKELGGDAAAHSATTQDLLAIKAYAAIDHPKLHTLGMVIVDVKGWRVTAQSIIPGILEREQEESIVYGSFDAGSTVVSSAAFEELLLEPAKQLKILPHRVWNGKEQDGQYVKLFSSYESKGILGNDSRHYLLDLLRTFPPDVNFIEQASDEVGEIGRSLGYPRRFKHRLTSLRQELVESFVNFRYLTFMRIASNLIQKYRAANGDEEKETLENLLKESPNEWESKLKELDSTSTSNSDSTQAAADDQQQQQLMADTSKLLGSLSASEFDVRFNPDCYFDGKIKHAPEEDLPSQRKLVAEAAEFLLGQQIPLFIRDCSHQSSMVPMDGQSLSEGLHSKGINYRYLGRVIQLCEGNDRLDFISRIAKVELLCRCARHVSRPYLQQVPAHQTGAAIAHFLNCLLGAGSGPTTSSGAMMMDDKVEALLTKGSSNNKSGGGGGRKKHRKSPTSTTSMALHDSSSSTAGWQKLDQSALWSQLKQDADDHYNFKLDDCFSCCDQFIEWSTAQRVSILRRFCQLIGVQLIMRNYPLMAKASTTPFTESDIQQVTPVVKHMNPRANDAYELYLSALAKMQQGYPRMGYELMAQAHQMMSNIYGLLHPDLALCLRLMARMAYAMGDVADALAQQHKATLISERCNGIDHFETVMDYINIAHYSFSNLYIASALRLLYRARFLLLLINGEDHPLMGQIDANIGVILYSTQEYEKALAFLNSALHLYTKYDVPFCLKTALVYHVLARTHSCRGDFRTALQMEKETFNIYCKIFGPEHDKTIMSGECLKHLTKQAVTFQKRMNDASKGTSGGGVNGWSSNQSLAQLIPVNIQPPSLQNIVEMLNAFNNFIFLKLKPISVGVGEEEVKVAVEQQQLKEEALD